MNRMTKMLFAALVMFSLSSGYSVENTLAYCDGCQKSERLCACPKQECNSCRCAPCCCECTPTPACPCPTVAAYSAPYREATCWDVYVSASYNYWLNAEDSLELGYEGTPVTYDGSNFNEDISFISNDCEYHSGFSVGLGKYFCWDNWDLYAEYTWFHNTTNTSKTASDSSINSFLWQVGFRDLTPREIAHNQVKSKWKLDMDLLDLELSRPYYLGCELLFRPHVGLRAAWIDQNYDLTYSDSFYGSEEAVLQINNSSDSWGIGARAGFDSTWRFCSGFYLYGNFAASILYTDYTSVKNSRESEFLGINDVRFTNSICTARPNMELALGLGWADYCDCDCSKWFLNLSVGYEFHTFWNQNVMRNIYDSNTGNTNLYLHGLTITAKLDF